MSKVPLQVFLDPRDHGLLVRLAGDLGLSKAEAVRVAIRRCAAEARGGSDPVLDFIGVMDPRALPADLSTRHDEYAVTRRPRRRVAERPRHRPPKE